MHHRSCRSKCEPTSGKFLARYSYPVTQERSKSGGNIDFSQATNKNISVPCGTKKKNNNILCGTVVQ